MVPGAALPPAAQKLPTSPALKPTDSFTPRRTSPGRLDIPSKVDGRAKYAIDGGALVSVDAAPADAMPGVKKVVLLKEAVAVVAGSFWRARKSLAALSPQFTDGGHGAVSTGAQCGRSSPWQPNRSLTGSASRRRPGFL